MTNRPAPARSGRGCLAENGNSASAPGPCAASGLGNGRRNGAYIRSSASPAQTDRQSCRRGAGCAFLPAFGLRSVQLCHGGRRRQAWHMGAYRRAAGIYRIFVYPEPPNIVCFYGAAGFLMQFYDGMQKFNKKNSAFGKNCLSKNERMFYY